MTLPRLHVVTDGDILSRSDFVATARALLEAHGAALALHVRGPHAAARRVYDAAEALAPVARAAGATLLVNDRVDIALACDAHGVHLGERSIPPADARPLMGGRLLGRSLHAVEGAEVLARWTDFLLLGTIYATSSHPDAVPLGPAAFAALGRTPVPVLAIGGITVGRVAEVVRAGAYGVAVVRGVWGSGEPVVAAGEYVGALEGVRR